MIEKFSQKAQQFLKREMRWLVPGIHIKRWWFLIFLGTTFLAAGFAVLVLGVYRTAPDRWWTSVLSYLSLQFLDRSLRVIIFGLTGLILIVTGMRGLNHSLLTPFVSPGKQAIETITEHRKRERGPKVIALGGGTGLSSLLRGMKNYTYNLTAVVTVADDGGSSGELRDRLGVLPPGDLRNCLTALSTDEAMLSQVFQYRFADNTGLKGHNLGNLFITAMADITGSFEKAVAESGRVLAVHGQVLPSTLKDVKLQADIENSQTRKLQRIRGESQIPHENGKIQRVWLEPGNPPAFPPSIQAILNADLIVIGPGSLYTSLMPNLLIPEIADAVRISKAMKFYICNIVTQPGETDGYNCLDHVRAIERHVGGRLFDVIICNDVYEGSVSQRSSWVRVDDEMRRQYAVYSTDLLDKSNPWRHDSQRLAQVVMDLFNDHTGPMLTRIVSIT